MRTRESIHTAAVAGLLAALMGCAVGPTARRPERFEGRPGAPSLLVLMPDSPLTQQVLQGLQDELGSGFTLEVQYLPSDARPEEVAAAVERVDPRAVILMNNPTVRLYRRYQRQTPGAERIPVIALLTSFLRQSAGGIENLTGVIYEVPLVTSLVNLRDLLDQQVRRVGVVHRRAFRAFLADQARLAGAEGFTMVRVEVEKGDPAQLRRAVERLRTEDRVDVIWILNDNALLQPSLIRRGWLPALRPNRTPVLVNVGSLLSDRVDFGTFAVLPDHRGLGVQAGGLITQLAEQAWDATGLPLEYPLSVEKVLNVDFAREHLALREQRLSTVDRLVD